MAKDPGKQRKLLYMALTNERHRRLSAALSKELQENYRTRSLPVRKGDIVTIMRGEHDGREGKISRVDANNYKVYIEGVTRNKVDGTTLLIPIHSSKITIKKLDLDDKWRSEILERKAVTKSTFSEQKMASKRDVKQNKANREEQ